MRGRIKLPGRTSLLALVVAAAALLVTQTAVFAANSQWKLGSYTANGGFSFKEAKNATFTFPTVPNPALLVTNKGTLVGNQFEKTITATFTISDPGNTFIYGGEPDGSGLPARVRLYFDSASIVSGTQVDTNYWWSDTAFQDLGNGTFTLTALVDPTAAQWSAYNGEVSNSYTAAFDAAASNMQDIGFSFGGGYFFANGVGTTDGMGTFVLISLTVS
jgi:hypothetical protein